MGPYLQLVGAHLVIYVSSKRNVFQHLCSGNMCLNLPGELKYTPPPPKKITYIPKKALFEKEIPFTNHRVSRYPCWRVYISQGVFFVQKFDKKSPAVLRCWSCSLHSASIYVNKLWVFWGCSHSTSRSFFINLHVGSHCVQYWYGIPRIYFITTLNKYENLQAQEANQVDDS